MCGICGYAGLESQEPLLRKMTRSIAHRGPDDDGFFVHHRVGIGVRRLSVIDVARGHQPIFNEARSVAIVYNGEIYNYRCLMADLKKRGHRFQTQSDTEVILHLYEEYGMNCLPYLRGMFAFALYDIQKDILFLVRDRLGIKPLYYWAHNGKLFFGSEVKTILEYDGVSREPYLPAIDTYLSLRYVPGPETMFSGIRKLPAAHWMSYHNGQIQLRRYWEPQFNEGPYQPDRYYQERFAELFTETVHQHLESDVPLGVFLSGGIDSGAIVAAMRPLVNRPVETFSVGFDWQGDELPVAREVARRLGCHYRETICRSEDIALLPQIVWHLDEPIGDAIVLPMYLLSRLARQHVKVVLSGEGGDETLAGYLFHKVMFWTGRYTRWVPEVIQKQLICPLLAKVPISLLNRTFSYPAQLGERGRRKVLDYLSLARKRPLEEEYRFLISLFDGGDKAGLYEGRMRSLLIRGPDRYDSKAQHREGVSLNRILKLQYADWLPDDILMKADKISMANSVEGRVPFMDHKLVEFLCQVPPRLKLMGWTDKWLLRNYVADVFPDGWARQPKKPFYIPLERYFHTPEYKELVETCLSKESVRRRGYFDWSAVHQLRRSVQEGDFLYGKQVLSLVMLELWHRIFIDREFGWAS